MSTEIVLLPEGPHRRLRRFAEHRTTPCRSARRSPTGSARFADCRTSQLLRHRPRSLVGQASAPDRTRPVRARHRRDPERSDRHLGFEHFFDDIVPEAVTRAQSDFCAADQKISRRTRWPGPGGPGGVKSRRNDQPAHRRRTFLPPVRSVTVVGTPLDYALVPPLPRTAVWSTKGLVVTGILRLLGGIPAPLVQIGYRATAWQRELKKPASSCPISVTPRSSRAWRSSIDSSASSPATRAAAWPNYVGVLHLSG